MSTPPVVIALALSLSSTTLAAFVSRREALTSFNIDFQHDGRFKGDASNYSAAILPNETFGIWEGWGTSLCWWAASFGDRDDLADVFFTLSNATTTAEGLSLPGLGFTVARYNAGGSSYASDPDGDVMQVSPNMIPSRQVFGFWNDWSSEDPSSASWGWDADPKQVLMLQKAAARGADKLELFSNSPMWWQCVTHNPSGSATGLTDNLQSWNYDDHALYLAAVALQFRTEKNVTFTSVDPFNEPVSDWWSSRGTQEGCHFERSTQATLVQLLRGALDSRGLSAVAVAASDENTYDLALETWESFDAATQALVGKVNTHGYQQAGGRRDLLFEAVADAGAGLWNSEYGEGDASGLSLAANLNLDLKWLHNTAWVYWQALDGGGWGLLQSDDDAGAVGAANSKFFVLAHYARHIRPGATVLGTTGADTIAAFDPQRGGAGTLVVVSVVYGSGRVVRVDLSALGCDAVAGRPVDRWATNAVATTTTDWGDGSHMAGRASSGGEGDRYAHYQDLVVGADGAFEVAFDANTIMTFEVAGVSLAAGLA